MNKGVGGRGRVVGTRKRIRERERREAVSQVIKLGNKPIDMPVGLQPPLAAEASSRASYPY